MRTAPPTRPSTDTSLREHVYAWLRDALSVGRFVPGQKLTFRSIAAATGVSLTPVREAIRRLVAEGAFEMQPNRSVRVPRMTVTKLLELCDIRVALESLATGKAARIMSKTEIADLQKIAREIARARDRGDVATDRTKIREFHFALYRAADQPILLAIIERLWLQTGPYLNLLFPDYVGTRRGVVGRARLIRALRERNAAAAKREIASDIRGALSYVASLADAAGNIVPASMPASGRRCRTRVT
ncbi:MAG: GntR family transcriptional regulator [Proteobacteria bacterium]|nr:GntR family transcriptional regulator [Pseudomonadota bacterium]